MAKIDKYCGYLLLFLVQNLVTAYPQLNRYNAHEIDNLKDLIQLLEDKLTPSDDSEAYPGSEDIRTEAEEDGGMPPETAEKEDRVNAADRFVPEDPVKSRVRDFLGLTRTGKSFNGCFGNRIERIGSWSGLGCNSIKTGTKKRIFGN